MPTRACPTSPRGLTQLSLALLTVPTGRMAPWPSPLSLREGGKIGIAGVNTHPLIQTVRSTFLSSWRDSALPDRPASGRIGERARAVAWRRGVWFLDWSYVVVPDPLRPGNVRYRAGREAVFAPRVREIPVVFDSGAYRALASCATRDELQRINLRALQAAAAGLWVFPDVLHDVNLADPTERAALKQTLLAQQLPLWT
jgi:hypothetical protein